MKLFQKKWFVIALLIVPNIVVAFLQGHQNAMFAFGAAMGAATTVFLFYLIVKTLLVKTKLRRELIVPISVVLSYAVYYALMAFL